MNIGNRVIAGFKELAGKLDRIIFGGPANTKTIFIYWEYMLLAVLFAAGALHWLCFLNFGLIGFKTGDWGFQYGYYNVLRGALTARAVPYHISAQILGFTDRFFSTDVSLSPQILLLPFMTIGKFVVANTLIMYSAGFAGCLLLKRRFGLSVFSFSILYLLFNFNGHITSHIAAGHLGWLGYFFLPYFFIYCFELDESSGKPLAAAKLALVLFLILLQGGVHIFVWCFMFTALLAIFNRSYLKKACLSLLLTVPLALFRILPSAITYTGVNHSFMIGYPNLAVMLDAFINIRSHSYLWISGGLKALNWWEYDIYTDITGLLMVLVFGLALRHVKKYDFSGADYRKFDMPLTVFSLFSMNYIYYIIASIPVPLMNSERVTSRFIIIPFLALLIFACARLEIFLRTASLNAKHKLLALALAVQLAFALAIHSRAWNLSLIERNTPAVPLSAALTAVSRPDALYVLCVKSSFALSALAFISVCVFILLKTDTNTLTLNKKEI